MSSYDALDDKMPSPPPYTEIAEVLPTHGDANAQAPHRNQQPTIIEPVPVPSVSGQSTHHSSIPYSTSTGVTIPPQNPQTIHIVYVHGFRGDHTTFQAFPSDLHNYLLPTLPGLQTWIYPTYKSAKPLSFAAKNLLTWLNSLEDGPIILAGHSMGGLLVAETALSPDPVAKRIIGLLAFDTPYLGMHPHVVISGIASLLPSDKKDEKDAKDATGDKADKGKQKEDASQSAGPNKLKKPPPVPGVGMKSERDVNDEEKVHFVDQSDAFPVSPGASIVETEENEKIDPAETLDANSRPGSPTQHSISSLTTSQTLHPGLSNASTTSVASSKASKASSFSKFSKSSIMSAAQSYMQKHADEPHMHFLIKHSDNLIGAMTTWVIQFFEFGFAMFDYGELVERYKKLEKWEGDWVNFWTETTTGTSSVISTNATKSTRASIPGTHTGNPTRDVPHISIIERDMIGVNERGSSDDDTFEAPPTPKKIARKIRPPTPSSRLEDEFDKAMKKAQKKDSKRRGKSSERAEKAQHPDSERTAHQDSDVESAGSHKSSRLRKDPKDGKEAKAKGEGHGIADALKLVHSVSSTIPIPEVVIEDRSDNGSGSVDGNSDLEDMNASFVTAHTSLSPPRTPPHQHRKIDSKPNSPPSKSSRSQSPRPKSPSQNSTKSPQHFITLPNSRPAFKVGTPEHRKRWIRVEIGGVEDEVNAHLGLFIRGHNLEYDRFVRRVGKLVQSWVQ